MSTPFFTPRQLAERWSLTPCTLKKWRCSGKGPHYHKLGRRIRYLLNDVEKFERQKLRYHTSMLEAPSLGAI